MGRKKVKKIMEALRIQHYLSELYAIVTFKIWKLWSH